MTAEVRPVCAGLTVCGLVARARDGDQAAWDALVPYAQISARLGIPAGRIGPSPPAAWTNCAATRLSPP